jgi:outer membrane protein
VARALPLAGVALALVGAAVLPALAGCHAGPRIAFVDVQRAINETREGVQSKAKLREIYGQRQRDLDKRQELLRQMEQRINAQKSNANADAYAHELGVYQTGVAELQKAYKAYQDDLQLREAEAVKGIVEKMKSLLAEIAGREGYTLVLEVNEGGAFYYDKNLDLTLEVIRLYDERFPPSE